jgi:hypothetical protein
MEADDIGEFQYVEDGFDVYIKTTTSLRRNKPFTHSKTIRLCKICGKRIESRKVQAIKHARTHQTSDFTSKYMEYLPNQFLISYASLVVTRESLESNQESGEPIGTNRDSMGVLIEKVLML